MRITNIHERAIRADRASAGALLDRLSSHDDRLWPHPHWPRQRFDRPLGVGASGGHGPIRYTVDAYEPGRHVSYRFDPRTGLRGSHWLDVVEQPDGHVCIRHVISAEATGWGLLRWLVAIRWLHDALLEDALDRAEHVLTGTVATPARWSRWVRTLRWVATRYLRSPSAGAPADAGAHEPAPAHPTSPTD